MSGRNIFLSYASGSFVAARDALCSSALRVNFDEARARGPSDLDRAFVQINQNILSQPRGGGYWLWKPQIILQELQTLASNELLVYSDAGRSSYYLLRRFPKQLAALARASGFLLGPTIGQHGPLAHWTKRDAFVLLGMDRTEVHTLPPIQATWSIWTPTKGAFDFLNEWVAACTDERVLTDISNTQGLENLAGFRDHRHDQSVLTLLAYRNGAPYIDREGTLSAFLTALRPVSRLSHFYMKRIDDAERTLSVGTLYAMARSFLDIRANAS